MRKLFALLLLSVAPVFAQSWVSDPEPYFPNGVTFGEASIIGFNRYGATANNPIIYFQTTLGGGYIGSPPYPVYQNQAWHTVNLAGKVPPGTKAVMLGGIGSAVINAGQGDGCTFTAAFVSADNPQGNDPDSGRYLYILQNIAFSGDGSGNGTRMPMFVIVPLDASLSFKFYPWWRANTDGNTNKNCYYFLSLRIEGYLR